MAFLNQLLILGQTWVGSSLTLLAIVTLLLLRRLLPQEQRKRGRVTFMMK
jgi:hypothetical protein